MSGHLPKRDMLDGETVEWDELTGRSWTVMEEHHGHTVQVVGRIMFGNGDASTSLRLRCSCGQVFRMGARAVAERIDPV